MDMVRYTSDGTFDAPIEKIWTLLQEEHAPDRITNIHKAIKKVEIISETEGSQVRDQIIHDEAGDVKERVRFNFQPPGGFDMEWLDGPLKGSKCTHRYTPMGDQTKVRVDGTFHLEGADDKTTEIMVDDLFTTAFNEDQEALKGL